MYFHITRTFSWPSAAGALLAICIAAGGQAAPQAVTPESPWPCHIIDGSAKGADGVKLADVNRDGFMDVTTGWEEKGLTRVYLNPGPQKAEEKWPAVTVGQSPSVEDAVFVDLDGDGAVDVVSCCEGSCQSMFVHWAPAGRDKYLQESKWRSQAIPASKGLTRWMFCIPMQVDGKFGVDLVAGSKAPNAQIGWWEVPQDARNLADYKWHSISPAGWIMSLRSIDMDGDGDLDILTSDRKGPMRACRWLENPGAGPVSRASSPRFEGETPSTQEWRNHFMGGRDKEVMFLTVADIDDDGLQDVLAAANADKAGQIVILRRLDAAGDLWKQYVIPYPDGTGTAKGVAVGDIDGDGTKDIVFSCENAKGPKVGVMWLSRNKGPFEGDWYAHDISGPAGIKYDLLELLDLDADGDLDVLACEEQEGGKGLGVFWYENPYAAASRQGNSPGQQPSP